jgi:hypothetical protein
MTQVIVYWLAGLGMEVNRGTWRWHGLAARDAVVA